MKIRGVCKLQLTLHGFESVVWSDVLAPLEVTLELLRTEPLRGTPTSLHH